MSLLETSDFTRDEVRKRMVERAASIWQMRVRDVDTADPLVGYLMDACAFEFENTSKVIESTRQRIIDRLASVMCPEVIDVPRPAHAVLSCRPESKVLDLPQSAQFYHRQLRKSDAGDNQDWLFSPVKMSRLINGEIRFILTEQELSQLRGRDRLTIQQKPQYDPMTSYQSVWIGLELDETVSSLSDLSFYFDWENETDATKAAYCRKIQDENQTSWWLNGQALSVKSGIYKPDNVEEEIDSFPFQRLSNELDGLELLEQEVVNYYEQAFVTMNQIPGGLEMDYSRYSYPSGFVLPDNLAQRFFNQKLLWIELRLRRDFPREAVVKMDIRINCFPVMNRRVNENYQRLQQSINVYPLISPEDFLFMKRVYYSDGSDLYRSSPLRSSEEMAENSFMYRAQGVGRFDVRDAREVLHYVQQLLREENRAFSALGSGVFMEIIAKLTQNVKDLKNKLERESVSGFKIGHPYVFIRPRDKMDSNVYIEFWSTNGAQANGIRAGSRINLHTESFGLNESSIVLLTDTVGGRDKPEVAEKELMLRQTLLARNRLVTQEDIRSACQSFFYKRLNNQVVKVTVRKGFAEGLVEGAGYVRCIDVLITPRNPEVLSPGDWVNECERCRYYLAGQSAMNLPYRVMMNM